MPLYTVAVSWPRTGRRVRSVLSELVMTALGTMRESRAEGGGNAGGP